MTDDTGYEQFPTPADYYMSKLGLSADEIAQSLNIPHDSAEYLRLKELEDKEMDTVVTLTGEELRELLAYMRGAIDNPTGFRRMEIGVSAEGIAVKVDNYTWSRPFSGEITRNQ